MKFLQIENRDRRLKELAEENAQLRSQPKHDDTEDENHYIQVIIIASSNNFKILFLLFSGKSKFTRTNSSKY